MREYPESATEDTGPPGFTAGIEPFGLLTTLSAVLTIRDRNDTRVRMGDFPHPHRDHGSWYYCCCNALQPRFVRKHLTPRSEAFTRISPRHLQAT